jgi:hypothetical protein
MPQREQAVNEDLPPHSADRMPTLTEVLELESPVRHEGDGAVALAEVAPTSGDSATAAALEATPDTASLVNEVLAELQPRIDMLFESRLREALAPALARAAEGLIRDARGELGSALHELVDDAVKRALQRRGGRW